MADLIPETEKVVCMPLPSPHTGRGSTKYRYAGMIDRIEGNRVIDWKSTSDPSKFVARKGIGYQPECYAMALRSLGYEIDEYEYRVIQTPGIRLSGTDEKAARETGRTPAECYEERCYEWIMERPGVRIFSATFPVNDECVRQAKHWLWTVRERISAARKSGTYLTNESACDAYNVMCPYVDLCKAAKFGDDVRELLEERYRAKGSTHMELGLQGSDIITYSSASTFSLCEQKWFWSTEMGLEKKGSPTSDALYVGSAMHEGLEHLDSDGLEAVIDRIWNWGEDHPVIGPDASKKQSENISKACAMIRAASTHWSIG